MPIHSPFLIAALLSSLGLPAPQKSTAFHLSPARVWTGGLAAAPRIPVVGDVNGDGKADCMALFPDGDGILDLALTSSLGKPRFPVQAKTSFGKDGQVVVFGRFHGNKTGDVLTISKSGVIQIAYQFGADSKFGLVETVQGIKTEFTPKFAAVLKSADNRDSVVIIDFKGMLYLLLNSKRSGTAEFTLESIPEAGFTGSQGTQSSSLGYEAFSNAEDVFGNTRQLASGNDGTTITWLHENGSLYQGTLDPEAIRKQITAKKAVGDKPLVKGKRIRPEIGPAVRHAHVLFHTTAVAHLAVGKFTNATTDDIIIGRTILQGKNYKRATFLDELPDASDNSNDLQWFAADIDGDGRDDLIRVRRSEEKFKGNDILVHFSRSNDAPDDLVSASGDGLLDAWKTGRIKPGGLDLAALGCKIGAKDILVEVQRVDDVAEDLVKKEMERATAFYAKIGFAFHPILREPIPLADSHHPWWELGQKYHPANHRGITHWMVVTNSGGGQSGELEDRGSCGSHALYATFLHEFGHQLGLDHTGRWAPNWCPIYPSMMNYAYSYQLGGKADDICYSDGRLASVVLDESHLSEILPLPMDKVSFLAGPPYRYRMKPSADGKSTLIDWNWNGVFGEESVSADINYGYSTTGGVRHVIGKSLTAPVLATLGKGESEKLIVFAGLPSTGMSAASSTEIGAKASLSPEFPGQLVVRRWDGKDATSEPKKWNEGVVVRAEGVIGDPSAATLDGSPYVAYPMKEGVWLAVINDEMAVESGVLLKSTESAQPTLAKVENSLVLVLWRGATNPIAIRRLTTDQSGQRRWQEEQMLALHSATPVAATEGAGGSLLLGLVQDRDANHKNSVKVVSLTFQIDGKPMIGSEEWVGSENSGQRTVSRPTLAWREDKALADRGGQLYVLSAGAYDAKNPWACHYISMRIADKTVNNGWLQRRYYDEWTQSRSTPGAVFYKGEMIFASRWHGDAPGWGDNDLFIGYSGRGLETEKMGDFDDIGFIRDYGMAHSILYAGE